MNIWIIQVDAHCDQGSLSRAISGITSGNFSALRIEPFNHAEPLHANRYNIYADDVEFPSLLNPSEIGNVVISAIRDAGITCKITAWHPEE